jgi:hypothetical protein
MLMMGGADMPFGEGTSNKAATWGRSAKRARGHVKVEHFNDDVGPTRFAKVVLSEVGNATDSHRLPPLPWHCHHVNHPQDEH